MLDYCDMGFYCDCSHRNRRAYLRPDAPSAGAEREPTADHV